MTILIFSLSNGLAQEIEEKTIILDSVLISDIPISGPGHSLNNYIEKTDLRSVGAHDIGDYLRSIPNISGIRKGGSAIDPVIRGFKYSQLNVILNNGDKMENGCPNRMDPVTAHIEAEDIEKIEIMKGPFSLRYGPVLGGTVNLVPQNPEPYEDFEIHANAVYGSESNWNGSKMHGMIKGGSQKVFFLASGGYRNYGDYRSGGWMGKDTTCNSSFKKYNYALKLGISPARSHKVIFAYNSIHGRDVMYPALPMDEKSDDTNTFSADYIAEKLSPFIKSLDVKIYRSDVHHIMDNSYRTGYEIMQMIADVNAINTGGNIFMDMQYSKHKIKAGLDYENINKDGSRMGTMRMMETTSVKITNLWNKALIRNTGIYSEYETYFSMYEFSISIRGDFNTATSEDTLKIIYNDTDYFNNTDSRFTNLSASIGITRTINRWFNISLGLGRGTRSPNMLERYIKLLPVGYDQYDYLGNPQLKPETNNEGDLTFKVDNKNAGSFYLNFFYSRIQNYISSKLLPSTVIKSKSQGVLGVRQFVNIDHAIHQGFEFGYKTPENHSLGGKITAAMTYGTIPDVTKYIISDNQVTDAVRLTDDALPEIPPMETNLNVYYNFFNGKLVPTFRLRVVSAQNHISEAYYEMRTPGFWTADITFTGRISDRISTNAGVTNIFDRNYFEHLNRRIIGTNKNLCEPGRVFFAAVYLNI